ncbi:hypothetical protein QBC34DRAFT_293232 [Podospora aff. communis PSN243]|uniref:Fumarylacetoacetase n=1 Tax=Podospora aff. communis PSN243 TaxID=3040156 RepID=A0AAV9GZI7_9PEZI|nr:hypothetical protein QBC34DRAFT_293232 [Podospora aff. communis PSN243]
MWEPNPKSPGNTPQVAPGSYSHHFSSANIPFGIASSFVHDRPQAVTRVKDVVIFLNLLAEDGFFSQVEGLPPGVFALDTLNDFAALPRTVHRQVRSTLQAALGATGDPSCFPLYAVAVVSMVTMHMPVRVGDFADFSCSEAHVSNAGRIAGQRDLPKAFYSHPIGYQGRASSIVISGTSIPRPKGHFSPDRIVTTFGPSTAVDYELEFAAIIGKPLPWGEQVNIAEVEGHVFGYVLLNDWSARDIQVFEMPPLGPFIGKNFGTSISPWVVTPDALGSFRTRGPYNPYRPRENHLEASLLSTYDIRMRVEIIVGGTRTVTCETNVAELYWTLLQAIVHLTSAGCGLRTGDIVATGTVSSAVQFGCLLESTNGGRAPITLNDGTQRCYLEDGDIVELSATAGGSGESGVGFGNCLGQIVASKGV